MAALRRWAVKSWNAMTMTTILVESVMEDTADTLQIPYRYLRLWQFFKGYMCD